MTTMLNGIAASNGIAIAKAYRLIEPDLTVAKKVIADVDEEVQRFKAAVDKSKTELQAIREHADKELGADKAAIFDAHLLVINDPELLGPVEEKIKCENVNAEFALKKLRICSLRCLNQWIMNI